jgi:glycosyltransferase involved in cell wall biosynthesis
MIRNRVLILVQNLPVPADRRVWLEAMALRDDGWTVSIVCPDGRGTSAGYQEVDGIHVYRHAAPPEGPSVLGYVREYALSLAREWRLVRRAWRERGFDVIHLCNPPDLLFLIALPYKLIRHVSVVFDHHDITPELYEVKYGRRDLAWAALRLAERATFAVADMVIATNGSYRAVAEGRGHVRPEDIVVVRSAPDLHTFVASEDLTRWLVPGRRLIGYVGVMGQQDGVDLLLRAADVLVHGQKRDSVLVRLIGDGPDLVRLRGLAEALSLTGHTEFLGFVSGQDMVDALAACDVCVVPDPSNPYNDRCTMNKVLEYMALAKPTAMFDLPEGRCSAGDAAVYAAGSDPSMLADAISQLLDDSGLARELGRKGRERMEGSLAWAYQAKRLTRAYARLARRNAS